jgi:uncharacterized protein involved in exopolysaccharide biosynthesis
LREDAEQRLAAAEDALRAFLTRQQLSDLDAELAATERLFAEVSAVLFAAEAAQSEAIGRTNGLRKQLVAAPPEIDLFQETASDQGRQPMARPAHDRPDTRVSPGGEGEPTPYLRRSGPNPTRLEIEARLADSGASIEAQESRVAELVRQKAEIEARRARLAAVEPDYRRLLRERDAIRSSAEAFAAQEEAGRSRTSPGQSGRGAVSVYQRTQPSAQGDAPRRMIMALGTGLGLLLALAIGLLRAWSANTFPTPTSLERSLGLPVLAAIPERRR